MNQVGGYEVTLPSHEAGFVAPPLNWRPAGQAAPQSSTWKIVGAVVVGLIAIEGVRRWMSTSRK